MPLQVAVDHEDLVAARMGTRSFPNLLMVLLNMFLLTECPKITMLFKSYTWAAHTARVLVNTTVPSCHRNLCTPLCNLGKDTCRWWAAPLWRTIQQAVTTHNLNTTGSAQWIHVWMWQCSPFRFGLFLGPWLLSLFRLWWRLCCLGSPLRWRRPEKINTYKKKKNCKWIGHHAVYYHKLLLFVRISLKPTHWDMFASRWANTFGFH